MPIACSKGSLSKAWQLSMKCVLLQVLFYDAPDSLSLSRGAVWTPLEIRSLLLVAGRNFSDEASRGQKVAGCRRQCSWEVTSPMCCLLVFHVPFSPSVLFPAAGSLCSIQPSMRLSHRSAVPCFGLGLISPDFLRTLLEIPEVVPSPCAQLTSYPRRYCHKSCGLICSGIGKAN